MSKIAVFPAMRTLLATVLTALLLALPAAAEGPKISWELNDALKQINRQADDFDTALSRIEMVRTNADGEEVERETATLFFNDDDKVRIDVDGTEKRTILVYRGDVYIHKPDRGLVEQYSLSKHKGRLEPFIRLGFSNTGKDLKDDYLVTSLGEKDIGESRTLGLDLTPKSEKVRAVVSRAQLWIDQASWMPTQQVISSTQSGEELVITYTHTARNLDLNPDLFKTRWPKGTNKLKM